MKKKKCVKCCEKKLPKYFNKRRGKGKLSTCGLTKTPEFKKWFGKSKVVDEKGNPLVVYHGTTHSWTIYDKEKGNPNSFLGAGFYASSNYQDVDHLSII